MFEGVSFVHGFRHARGVCELIQVATLRVAGEWGRECVRSLISLSLGLAMRHIGIAQLKARFHQLRVFLTCVAG